MVDSVGVARSVPMGDSAEMARSPDMVDSVVVARLKLMGDLSLVALLHGSPKGTISIARGRDVIAANGGEAPTARD
jgi:hypothetical protein